MLLNEVPLQARLQEHISSATAPQRIRTGCTASMPLPGRVLQAFSVTLDGPLSVLRGRNCCLLKAFRYQVSAINNEQ
ncbi:MAG: hypothetical protein EBS53_18945 [Bacteroidetes bacterium]|nr:hypothetical protein [Bacteroidota bacterium]